MYQVLTHFSGKLQMLFKKRHWLSHSGKESKSKQSSLSWSVLQICNSVRKREQPLQPNAILQLSLPPRMKGTSFRRVFLLIPHNILHRNTAHLTTLIKF